MSTQALQGIHHITAIAGPAHENLEFYTGVLGLRLVKKTVNFDDPGTYHLYYGDQAGAPGTILTFFPWAHARRGRPGAGMVTAIAFTIAHTAFDYWLARLDEHGIAVNREERFGDRVLRFEAPDGLVLELVATDEAPGTTPWPGAGVPPPHQLRGFHSVTHLVAGEQGTVRLLEETMGLEETAREDRRVRYRMAAEGAPGLYYDLLADPAASRGAPGAGTVHHLAFRNHDDADQAAWRKRLAGAGASVSPVMDRNYFHSIYYREPSGVLFEMATDPPGFTVDESLEALGSALRLPAVYEPRRAAIERQLPPLEAHPFEHIFRPGEKGQPTILTLHGTGGSEHDLVPLAEEVLPGAGILSPRGRVREGAMARFFKRKAMNVFDEESLRTETRALARFVTAKLEGQSHGSGIIALGYSNGANIGANLLFTHPELLEGAVLLRPMSPGETGASPDLRGKRVLVLRGEHDTMIPSAGTDRLVEQLRAFRAEVDEIVIPAGHGLTHEDLALTRRWFMGEPLPTATGA